MRKKHGKKWRKGRDRTNPSGEIREKEAEEKNENNYSEILNKLEIIGDPYDQMNMKTKKTHTLHHFYDYIKVMIS